MPLVVEDGTGLANADAYVSTAEVTAYVAAYVGTSTPWSSAASGDQEVAVRKATQYLDSVYGGRWRGSKREIEASLDWPRTSVFDRDGHLLSSETLPLGLKQACCLLAIAAVQEDIYPDIATPGSVKRYRAQVGPLEEETEWAGARGQYKKYSRVEALLSDLLQEGYVVERA